MKKLEELTEKELQEYEDYLKQHKRNNFELSIDWGELKGNWKKYLVISRDEKDKIDGVLMVWIRKLPIIGKIIFIPRGPVANIYSDVPKNMFETVKNFAIKEKIFLIHVEPDVVKEDNKIAKVLEELGFTKKETTNIIYDRKSTGVSLILDLENKTEDEIFKYMASGSRLNIRYAIKNNVKIEYKGVEALEEFYREFCKASLNLDLKSKDYEYFVKIFEVFGQYTKLVFAKHENTILYAGIIIEYGNKTWLLAGVDTKQKQRYNGSYLAQWSIIQRAIKKGNIAYDMMGVPGLKTHVYDIPPYDLYRFKKSFGAKLHVYMNPYFFIQSSFRYDIYKFLTWIKREKRIFKGKRKQVDKKINIRNEHLD